MCEIMEELCNEAKIQGAVLGFRAIGNSFNEAVVNLCRTFNLTTEMAETFVTRYWNNPAGIKPSFPQEETAERSPVSN